MVTLKIKWAIIFIFMALVFQQMFLFKQLDVCHVFLNGELLEERFVVQWKTFEI